MSRPNKEEFRIDIRGEFVNYYYNIKERNGIEKNVEVFRHSLKTTEDFEAGDLRPASDIHPKLQYTIDHYLTRSDVQRQFDLKNKENLIRNAVGEYITKIEEFVKGRSLINWDVRAGLQGDPHKAALVFMEL
ncbi:MAG: hypothetical protein ACXAE3_17600, partial [Candidatus Kariarchaeaceae archaeon]